MGTWNAGLFSNDTTCDVRTTYIQFLEQQLSNQEAFQKTLETYNELIGTDEEDLFWYAIADVQWDLGRLMADVKKIALERIGQKGGCSLWAESPKKVAKWENTLQKLKSKLESPMPTEKKINKPLDFVRNPWNAGDIYAYQFHTEKAEQHGLFGKYILFQKLGDVPYYDDTIFSVIQLLDRVFDHIPMMDALKDIRVLPLAAPPGIDGTPAKIDEYVPSFDWYLKGTMIYEKQCHYPKKHFIYVGNQPVFQNEYVGNQMTSFFLAKDKMEEWLIDFYIMWQNIMY